MFGYHIDKMSEVDKSAVVDLLKSYRLKLEDHLDLTLVMRHHQEIVGTCSFRGDTIRSLAIKPCYANGRIATELVSEILGEMFDRGIYTAKVITRKENLARFKGMGFKYIYHDDLLALLVYGNNDLEKYLKAVEIELGKGEDRAAIVMNANPFTKGHLHLVTEAAKASKELIIFVVEDESSYFTYKQRKEMIEAGVAHLDHVYVVGAGSYIVSSFTFPEYFIREASERARQSSALDAGVFSCIIAKRLGITKRYIGTEPFCDLTQIYNSVLVNVLPVKGIDVTVIPRLSEKEEAISASNVRRLLALGHFESIERLVPQTTYKVLKSLRDQAKFDMIKADEGVH